MKKPIYFEMLNNAYNDYLLKQQEVDATNKKMEEEIKESERKIRDSYQEKIETTKNNISTIVGKIIDYRELVITYSAFNSKVIGNILAKLITIFEGEEYSYNEATHATYEFEPTMFGREAFKAEKQVIMIIKNSQKRNFYRDHNEQNNEIYQLSKNGHALILANTKKYSSENITFYSNQKVMATSSINFEKFPYVKEYIDLVIQYRFEENKEEITESELLTLLSEFIMSKKEFIENNYKKRALEEVELRKHVLNDVIANCKETFPSEEKELGLSRKIKN